MFPKLGRPLLKKIAQVAFFQRGTALFLLSAIRLSHSSVLFSKFQAASICGTITFAGSNRDSNDSASAIEMSSGTCWPLVV